MRTNKEVVTQLALAVSTLTLPAQAQVDEPFNVFDGLGSQDLQFNHVTGGIRLGID